MIYYDNCATTRISPAALDKAAEVARDIFGNPSSRHALGYAAERTLSDARGVLARFLGCDDAELHFTSGGTESNNEALYALARSPKAKRCLVLSTDHPSVLETVKSLARLGLETVLLPVDHWGIIDLEVLRKEAESGAAFAAISYVNNETGAVQPLSAVGGILEKAGIPLHIDGVQAAGHIPFTLSDLPCRTFSLSAHKIHGAKGVGALYIRKGFFSPALIYGGFQENGRRAGTENMPGIAAFAVAAGEAAAQFSARNDRCRQVRESLLGEILRLVPDIAVNTDMENSSPHVLNISFFGVKSEVFMRHLEQKNIFVSAGTACLSHGGKKTGIVLRAMGKSKEEIDSAIRFSFSHENTAAEALYAAEQIAKIALEIRSLKLPVY